MSHGLNLSEVLCKIEALTIDFFVNYSIVLQIAVKLTYKVK